MGHSMYLDDVDGLISAIKKAYRNPLKGFKLKCPVVKLPLSPVLTRWGTCLEAAVFHANNFEGVKSAVSELDSSDSVAISTAKALMESELIVANLAYISAYHSSIPKTLRLLK